LGSMPDSNDGQKRLSGVIIEESSRLNNIVTEFLDFARPQELNLQNCNIEEIIRKNIDFLGPELEKKKISVRENFEPQPFELKADAQLLYRSFLNIFINAIQSMEDGGTLSICVANNKDDFMVTIGDTGSGINKENLDRIFDPFFSTKDKGSGLGLAIVRNIIEGHNGSIWIESKVKDPQGLGEAGTKVVIKLPKA